METSERPTPARRAEILPTSLPPFGVSREQAAALLGISATLFDWAVTNGRMPQPRLLRGRNIWDVEELVTSFRELPHRNGKAGDDGLDEQTEAGNPWDDV